MSDLRERVLHEAFVCAAGYGWGTCPLTVTKRNGRGDDIPMDLGPDNSNAEWVERIAVIWKLCENDPAAFYDRFYHTMPDLFEVVR